jgi:hypothetical protein
MLPLDIFGERLAPLYSGGFGKTTGGDHATIRFSNLNVITAFSPRCAPAQLTAAKSEVPIGQHAAQPARSGELARALTFRTWQIPIQGLSA